MTLSDDHDDLLERGRRLQVWTIAWNVGEFFITVGLGLAAGSLALVAYGLDSVVEVFASAVAIWYIARHHEDRRSYRALRLVAVAFVLLALYLFASSGIALANHHVAENSPWGIAYLCVTALVMFALAAVKYRIARRANSAPLAAEAAMTLLDGWLATGILAALVLNAVLGWWWADPVAAIGVGVACLIAAFDSWRESGGEVEPPG